MQKYNLLPPILNYKIVKNAKSWFQEKYAAKLVTDITHVVNVKSCSNRSDSSAYT